MKKREHRAVTTDQFYKDFELYSRTEAKAKEGFYEVMVERAIDDLEAILSNHNKMNVIRFDLYFKKPVDDEYFRMNPRDVNPLVSRFFKSLKGKMTRWQKDGKNRGLKSNQIAYQYAMEETSEKLVHVHCYLAYKGLAQQANGSRIADKQSGEKIGIYRMIEESWQSVVPDKHGRVWFSDTNHFYYIDRNSDDFQDKIENCIYGLSYIAKVFSKNTIEVDNSRRFNGSQRIKRGHHPIELKGRRLTKKEIEAARTAA